MAIANITNNILTDSGVATSSLQPTISLTTTGTSGASTLISNTLNIPNYGSALTGYVPTSRQLTINGTAYDLSADRSWSVGTVTSVAALTIGTSGTDLSSTVATNTTTPVITLNVPTASAANRGVLSSSDWSYFNGKQGTIFTTAPLSIISNTISITQASASVDGYLSSTDWNTFNNRVSSSGTTGYIPKFSSSNSINNSGLYDDGTQVSLISRTLSGSSASFTSSVTATGFFESSDSRLKTLIQDNYQTKGIASITPKLYTKNGKVELGYYAQDFVGVLDSAISKGSDDMLSLSYREVLVAKVYALEQRIKELETK
jgi:predicted heme/steroid binding protein